MKRRRYPRYRDSGVEWLGDVPGHWEMVQLGRIGSFFKGSGGTKEDAIDGGIPCIRYGDLYTTHQFLIRNSGAGIAEQRTAAYTPLRYGDILLAGSGETLAEIGKSAANLIRGRAYCGGDVIVFRPLLPTDATYMGYMLDCPPSAHQKARMGRGVTVMHIYAAELKRLLVTLPPLDEQRDIAAFLDRETGWIDTLIEKKELLIERLQEYRTALITRTVTRGLPPEAARAAGLDPSPRLKPSGVEWLGDVPEHWETRRVLRICRLAYGEALPSETREEGDVAVYGSNGVVGVHNLPNTLAPVVVVGRKGSHGQVNYDRGAVFAIDTTYFVDQRCTESDIRWLYYALLCADLSAVSMDSAVPGLSRDAAYAKQLVVPPPDEQRAIAGFLDHETKRFDELLARACSHRLRVVAE